MPNDDLNDLPLLFIPAYPPPTLPAPDRGDVGNRPLPAAVPVWASAGLQALTPYHPGAPLTVQVTVASWQGGNSPTPADVAVWWSPPASGPTKLDPSRFIGYASLPVAPHGGRATTPAMTGTIPASAGPHICLFALVWNDLDLPATAVADPANNPHWAQRNLIEVACPAPAPIAFLATNPFQDRQDLSLHVRAVSQETLATLAQGRDAEPVQLPGQFRLREQDTGAQTVGERSITHATSLEPGDERGMELTITLPDPPAPGAFTAFEVLQHNGDAVVGGLGVVALG